MSAGAMRFRLRYLHHDLELSEGEFAIGRSAECQLSLDDPLVSRRHALLAVTKESVVVEDLGSRNGVLVNGLRIGDKVRLTPGDRLLIGSQELMLLLVREETGSETTGVQLSKSTLPTLIAIREAAELAAKVSAPPRAGDAPSDAAARVPTDRSPATDRQLAADELTNPVIERRADVFNLLGRVADKALALGRADEAERLLASALAEVLEASRTGKKLSAPLIDLAARFAAKLATATAKGPWVDYVIELYDTQDRLCPASVVDELYGALRKVSAIDQARLRAYVGRLRDRQASLGPAE